MPSTANTSAGTKMYISATLPGTYDKAGFEALTWTEIGEITEIPAFGKVFNIVTHLPLASRQTIKRKGSFDNGDVEVAYAMPLLGSTSDAGQTIITAAVDSDNSYAFKIGIKDPAVKVVYFSSQVTSQPLNLGSTDSIAMYSSTLAIDDDVLIENPPA